MAAVPQPIPCHAPLPVPRVSWSVPWHGRKALVASFRIDRRAQPRASLPGSITILGLGTEIGRIVELTRLDSAPWWVAGDAADPIPVGIRVSVGFSASDARPASAVVRRCQRRPDGTYRVAVQFDGAAFL